MLTLYRKEIPTKYKGMPLYTLKTWAHYIGTTDRMKYVGKPLEQCKTRIDYHHWINRRLSKFGRIYPFISITSGLNTLYFEPWITTFWTASYSRNIKDTLKKLSLTIQALKNTLVLDVVYYICEFEMKLMDLRIV